MHIPLPMPNITFNPSLSVIPNALLNKPETNPPFYAEPQIPNFNIPSFEPPIRNQPININKKEPPISEPPDIITGNGEKIKPPPEVYQPIPQDEVSKPKELFIGNEIIKTKHDLHKEQMKQIIPITPPTTKPEKIKDPEGLGANIPISKIGKIAGIITTGALSGGLTSVGEAALTGGLGSLTSEGVISSIVGSGVGSGVSDVIGGEGIIPSVVGGIAGSVAAKSAVKKYRTKQRQYNEQQEVMEPLLGAQRGQGYRLGGGNSGFNRTTGEPIYKSGNDPEVQNMSEMDLNLLRSNLRVENDRMGTEGMRKISQPSIIDRLKQAYKDIKGDIGGKNKKPGETFSQLLSDSFKGVREEFGEYAKAISGLFKKDKRNICKITTKLKTT